MRHTYRIARSIDDELRELSQQTGRKLSDLLREALVDLLRKHRAV